MNEIRYFSGISSDVDAKVIVRAACIHGKASVRIYLSGFYRHTF